MEGENRENQKEIWSQDYYGNLGNERVEAWSGIMTVEMGNKAWVEESSVATDRQICRT